MFFCIIKSTDTICDLIALTNMTTQYVLKTQLHGKNSDYTDSMWQYHIAVYWTPTSISVVGQYHPIKSHSQDICQALKAPSQTKKVEFSEILRQNAPS